MFDLKNVQIFQGVPPEIIANIMATVPKEQYHPGEIIMHEGDDSNAKGYIIEDGEVDIYVHGDFITSLKSGEIFGEIALLNEETRTATVSARTEVTLIILRRESLIHLISNNETINKEIMRRIEENIKNESR